MPNPALITFLQDEIVPALPNGQLTPGKKTIELDLTYGEQGHIRVLVVEYESTISLSFARLDASDGTTDQPSTLVKKPHLFFYTSLKDWAEFEAKKAELLEKVRSAILDQGGIF